MFTAAWSGAATLPPGFSETTIPGLTKGTAIDLAPDGRIFVCQQQGALRIIEDGALLSTPFLTVGVDPTGERGLLGVALDPNYATNQYVYIYYTVPGVSGDPVHNRVSRFTGDGDQVVPGSEFPLLDLDPVYTQHHNGGALHFGTDGKLYVAVGNDQNMGPGVRMTTRRT